MTVKHTRVAPSWLGVWIFKRVSGRSRTSDGAVSSILLHYQYQTVTGYNPSACDIRFDGLLFPFFYALRGRAFDSVGNVQCVPMTLIAVEDDGKPSRWRAMLYPLRILPKVPAAATKPKTKTKTATSYFALFRPLQDLQSRLILCCGIICALAAGAPLPIIGVIFSKIIDVFPPSEAEVLQRIKELLGVGA